jgi:cobalt-zinc-cadmium efflux system outer membrane protein
MNRAILIICIIAFSVDGTAQTLDSLYQIAEQNNPGMIALNKWLESEKVRARTDIYPDNPEISYLYLFGNQESIGDQQELEVMQSFRLPGYYTSKADIQGMQYEQKVKIAEQEKRKLFYSVSESYLTLVWLRKKIDLLNARKSNSEKLASLMEQAFDKKEVSRATYEKAKIMDLTIQGEWKKSMAEMDNQRFRLEQISGGMKMDHLVPRYPEQWILLPKDSLLVQVISQNPELAMAKLNIEENERQIQFEKWNRWPVIRAGYKSEMILDQKLQGVHTGISIPLWQNKNHVQQVQLQRDWSHAQYQQKEIEILTEFSSLYNEVLTNYDNYLSLKEIISDTEVLENSLDLLMAGQISFPEYLIEIDFYNDAMESFLLMEREYYLGLVRLKQIVSFD